MRAKFINEGYDDENYGGINSTLLIVKENNYDDIKLWLKYNGLDYYSEIYDTIDYIKTTFDKSPFRLNASVYKSLMSCEYKSSKGNTKAEIHFYEDKDYFTVNLIKPNWDGKAMHYNTLKSQSIHFDDINEINNFL